MPVIRFAVTAQDKQKRPQIIGPLHKEIIKRAGSRVWGDEPLSFVPSEPGPGVISFGEHPDAIWAPSPAQMLSAGHATGWLTRAFDIYEYGPVVRETDLNLKVMEKWTDLDALGPNIIVDIETKGDLDGPRHLLELLCTGLWDGRPDFPVLVVPRDALSDPEPLMRVLSERRIGNHNGKFDVPVLNIKGNRNLYPAADTMLLHYAMNPGAGDHKLKHVARQILGVPDWERDIKKYLKGKDYSTIPPEILMKYCGFDVFYTGHLLAWLATNATPDQLRFYESRLKDSHLLQDIENSGGVHVDTDYLLELDKEIGDDVKRLRVELQHMTGIETFNPASPIQVKKYLATQGVKAKSTDEASLGKMIEDGKAVEFCAKMLEFRELSKEHGTYVVSTLSNQHDGVLFPGFHLHSTITGRTASSNPNIQNIPRKKRIKKIYVAPPKHVVLAADYSQIEARVMACLSGDPALIAKFQPDSPDFFDQLMTTLFPKDFPTLDSYLAYEQEKCNGDETEYRVKAKTVIYGLSFDRGAGAIGAELKITGDEAQMLINNFLGEHHVLADWRAETRAKGIAGTLMALDGQLFQQDTITHRNEAAVGRSALSFMPQHHANQIMLGAAKKIHPVLGDRGRIHALVHDAVYLYAREEHAEQVKGEVQDLMAEAGRDLFGDTVVFSASAKIGRSWADV